MKIIVLQIVATLICLIVSNRAKANEEITSELFCNNPAAIVCGDLSNLEKNYDSLRAYFLNQALVKTQKEFPKITMDDQGLNLESLPENDQEIASQNFLQSLDEAFDNELQKRKISIEIKDIRDIIIPIIKQASTYYEDPKIEENIKDIKIAISANQFKKLIPSYDPSKNTYSNSVHAYDRTCSGLNPNAVFDPYENTLIICPGLILRALSELSDVTGFSKQTLLTNLTFIIGHEFSHSLDNDMHLGSFYQCLKTDTSHAPIEFNMMEKKRETYADFWAYKGLTPILHKQKTLAGKIMILKNAMHSLCLYEKVGSHPTSKFRINSLLNYPVVADEFGCKVGNHPACN